MKPIMARGCWQFRAWASLRSAAESVNQRPTGTPVRVRSIVLIPCHKSRSLSGPARRRWGSPRRTNPGRNISALWCREMGSRLDAVSRSKVSACHQSGILMLLTDEQDQPRRHQADDAGQQEGDRVVVHFSAEDPRNPHRGRAASLMHRGDPPGHHGGVTPAERRLSQTDGRRYARAPVEPLEDGKQRQSVDGAVERERQIHQRKSAETIVGKEQQTTVDPIR